MHYPFLVSAGYQNSDYNDVAQNQCATTRELDKYMTKIVDLDHKWALMIGRVFIAFGAIEKLTHDCLIEWLQDPIYMHLKNQQLSKRIDLVIELVRSKGFKSDNTEKFVILLNAAKRLAEKRNLLAHNPLLLDLFSGEFQEIIQSNLKDHVFIKFEELVKIVDESEALESQLIEAKVY